MPPDPNWLYSAIAQATAAIVAILGGFITGSVLQRSAHRDSLIARLRERERRIRSLRERRTDTEHRLRTKQAFDVIDDAIHDVIRDLFQPKHLTIAEEARKKYRGYHIDLQYFAPAWQSITDAIKKEMSLLEADLQKYGATADNFDEWVKGNDIDLSGRDIWLADLLFEYIIDEAEKSRKAKDAARRSKSLFDLSMPDIDIPVTPVFSQHTINEHAARARFVEEEESKLRQLDSDVASNEGELTLLHDELSSFRHPPHIWMGLLVLAAFSIVGIIIPLSFMPQNANDFNNLHKLLVIIFFAAGLFTVFVYVIFLVIHSVRANSSEIHSEMP